MELPKVESLPPPPSVVSSIKAGFDAIAAHITAILLPLALDLFLWLGPRLSMEKLFLSIQADIVELWRSSGISAADIRTVTSWYAEMLPKLNLFWLLRAIPIGISSLLYGRDIPQTPLGTRSILQVGSDGNLLGWMSALTLVGWIGGGMFFRRVAWLATAKGEDDPVHAGRAIGQTILLSMFWTGIALAILVPVIIFMSLLLQFNQFFGQITILVVSLFSMWLIVPMFFWPHGVFIRKENALVSILSSMRLARFTLPTSSIFVLTVFLLSVGLNFLWNIPPKDSWMTLVGLLGHAFVTTALLAASFIYYRDMNIWLQTVLDRLKTNAATKQM
jgi:uncharacterized membrane protein